MPPVLHGQAEAGGHRRPGRALRAPLRPSRQEVLTAPAPSPGPDPDRRARLRQTKLQAVVAGRWPGDGRRGASHPAGAALVDPASGTAWVLVDQPGAGLGAALAWRWRHAARQLHLIVDEAGAGAGAAGELARRAARFADPPEVWLLDGRDLRAAEPSPAPPELPVPDGAAALAPVLEEAGTDPVAEHGVLAGEVLGLEVARVVADPDGGWRVAAGVGAHDREALAELRPDEDPADGLRRAAEAVRRHRRPGAPAHPANLLARERWLRAVLLARPGLAGAASLRAVPPPDPRTDLRRPAPAPAVGDAAGGGPVVVVASVGIDPELVPAAAEVRDRHLPGAALRIVVPDGDDHPVTRDLAAALAEPAELVVVPRDWAGAGGPGPAGR